MTDQVIWLTDSNGTFVWLTLLTSTIKNLRSDDELSLSCPNLSRCLECLLFGIKWPFINRNWTASISYCNRLIHLQGGNSSPIIINRAIVPFQCLCYTWRIRGQDLNHLLHYPVSCDALRCHFQLGTCWVKKQTAMLQVCGSAFAIPRYHAWPKPESKAKFAGLKYKRCSHFTEKLAWLELTSNSHGQKEHCCSFSAPSHASRSGLNHYKYPTACSHPMLMHARYIYRSKKHSKVLQHGPDAVSQVSHCFPSAPDHGRPR